MPSLCLPVMMKIARAEMPGPSPEELDRQEMTFVEDMFQLLQATHFRVLSADEWATAQQENFTVCPLVHCLVRSSFPPTQRPTPQRMSMS